jgi:hypothetical protein
MKKNYHNPASSLFFLQLPWKWKINKEKWMIIGLWLIVLTGIRFMLAFALRNIWIGTFGSVALTFLIFYLIIKYTAMQKYAFTANKILSDWYKRRYFIVSMTLTSVILLCLLLTIEDGYLNYRDKLVKLNVFESDDKQLEKELGPVENYPLMEKVAITIASIDISLDGNYSRTTSYLLAEDLEMLVFVFVVRKRANLFFRNNRCEL